MKSHREKSQIPLLLTWSPCYSPVTEICFLGHFLPSSVSGFNLALRSCVLKDLLGGFVRDKVVLGELA